MDFSLNVQQKLIRDTVRQFMEAEVRPLRFLTIPLALME